MGLHWFWSFSLSSRMAFVSAATSPQDLQYGGCRCYKFSAELKRPRKYLRIRPDIFDFEPELDLKLGQTKPKISGTVSTRPAN